MSMPRIGIVSTWASRLGGGVFEAVVAHAELVRDCGYEPVVFALADEHSAADRHRFGDTEVFACRVIGPEVPGYAPAMAREMRAAKLDLVHQHGIWRFPTRAAGDWAKATGRPYIISPHGMLDPWIVGRGKLKKVAARLGYEHRSWRLASRFHALTHQEAEDIARETGRHDACDVVPNAVAAAMHADPGGAPVLLYIGRIHPKKNLGALIDGWELAADVLRPLRARLLIAGWGEDGDVAALRERLARHDGGDVEFLGPVYGERKAELLAGARFLTLPSHSEGLPVAVLEAWAAGTPVLMSAHCHLPEGYAAGAAIDCGTEPGAIAAALRTSFGMAMPAWREMSAAATALAASTFSPQRVTARWQDIYARLLR